MAEAVTLLVFVLMLLGCVLTDISVIYALIGGLACFSIYTLYNKYPVSQLGKMLWKGVKDSRTILVVFVLIGFLTAVWRASGTYHVLCIIQRHPWRPDTIWCLHSCSAAGCLR